MIHGILFNFSSNFDVFLLSSFISNQKLVGDHDFHSFSVWILPTDPSFLLSVKDWGWIFDNAPYHQKLFPSSSKLFPPTLAGIKRNIYPPGYDIDFRNLYTINLGIFVQSATGWTSKLYLACIVMRPRRILVGIIGTSTFYTILN